MMQGNASRSGVAPKYRDPESGSTWSGRGKPPKWIAGQDRDNFLIGAIRDTLNDRESQPKRRVLQVAAQLLQKNIDSQNHLAA